MLAQAKVKKWSFFTSHETLPISHSYLEQAGRLINNWTSHFPKEQNWVQEHLHVPSMFVSLECSINGHLQTYEVNESPTGLGIAQKVNPRFAKKFKKITKDWPDIKLVSSPSSPNDDDWLETITLEQAQNSSDILLVRSEPHDLMYRQFSSRAINPVIQIGNRQYGEPLGLWEKVNCSDTGTFDWNEGGFCLKPLCSHRGQVYIWRKGRTQFRKKQHIGGITTKSKIISTLEENGEMYYQPFIQPMTHQSSKQPTVFYIYFLYDIKSREYVHAGSVWLSRPNLKIQGAPDTTYGPVVIN
jgi:hypothetical protein